MNANANAEAREPIMVTDTVYAKLTAEELVEETLRFTNGDTGMALLVGDVLGLIRAQLVGAGLIEVVPGEPEDAMVFHRPVHEVMEIPRTLVTVMLDGQDPDKLIPTVTLHFARQMALESVAGLEITKRGYRLALH